MADTAAPTKLALRTPSFCVRRTHIAWKLLVRRAPLYLLCVIFFLEYCTRQELGIYSRSIVYYPILSGAVCIPPVLFAACPALHKKRLSLLLRRVLGGCVGLSDALVTMLLYMSTRARVKYLLGHEFNLKRFCGEFDDNDTS